MRSLPNLKTLASGLLFMAGSAWAGAAELPAHVETPSLTFSLLRVTGALAVVFAVFLGGVWLFRNWQRLTVLRGRAPRLNVLEVKSLGPRQALYLIGYEQQRFLLSSGPTGISLLTALPPGSTAEAPAEPAPSRSFATLLAAALSPHRAGAGGPK